MLRATPEDFEVDEILGFAASGEGPHALLRVRKRGANTEWVARELARAVGVKPFEVGFAGLKDRNAVTTQHFTVPRGKRAAEEFIGFKGEGYEVLSAAAHQRKLPRGALEGNRFVITVRGLACDAAQLAERVQHIATGGCPNYFGEQRFGREAGNLEQVLRRAQRLAEGGRSDRRSRGPRRCRLHAVGRAQRDLQCHAGGARGAGHLESPVDRRCRESRWPRQRVRRRRRGCRTRAALRRARRASHRATGRGRASRSRAGEVLALEDAVAAQFPEALAVIHAEGMKPERRALRIRVRDLEHEYSGDTLRLRFALSAGSFATTVLREIIAGAATGE